MVDPLIHALQDENSLVRTEAAVALGYIGDVRAAKPLAELFKDNSAKRAAYEALARIGPSAASLLFAHLMNDDLELRRGAEETLVKIGHPIADSLIRQVQSRDSDMRFKRSES